MKRKRQKIPVREKTLVEYKKLFNNEVIHIERFIPEKKGAEKKFLMKCNCGKEYPLNKSDIEYAIVHNDYSDIRCETCETNNISYSIKGYERKSIKEVDLIPEKTIDFKIEDILIGNTNFITDEKIIGNNEIKDYNFDFNNLTLLQYSQIKFSEIAWIIDAQYQKLRPHKLSLSFYDRRALLKYTMICPNCFQIFYREHSQVLGAVHKKAICLCPTCTGKKANDYEKIKLNLKFPKLAKPIIPELKFQNLRKSRIAKTTEKLINSMPQTKIIGISALVNSNQYLKVVCNICGDPAYISLQTLRANHQYRLSGGARCTICSTIYDKTIIPNNAITILNPTPKLQFDREYFAYIQSIPEKIKNQAINNRFTLLFNGISESITESIIKESEVDVESEIVESEVDVESEIVEPEVDVESEIVESEIVVESKVEVIEPVLDSFFHQIIKSDRFKRLVEDKLSDKISDVYCERMQEEERIKG